MALPYTMGHTKNVYILVDSISFSPALRNVLMIGYVLLCHLSLLSCTNQRHDAVMMKNHERVSTNVFLFLQVDDDDDCPHSLKEIEERRRRELKHGRLRRDHRGPHDVRGRRNPIRTCER